VKEALVRRVSQSVSKPSKIAAPFQQENILPRQRQQKRVMEPDDLLCSRNARPQKALVERAQWKINQPPSLKDNERAWREHV